MYQIGHPQRTRLLERALEDEPAVQVYVDRRLPDRRSLDQDLDPSIVHDDEVVSQQRDQSEYGKHVLTTCTAYRSLEDLLPEVDLDRLVSPTELEPFWWSAFLSHEVDGKITP